MIHSRSAALERHGAGLGVKIPIADLAQITVDPKIRSTHKYSQ